MCEIRVYLILAHPLRGQLILRFKAFPFESRGMNYMQVCVTGANGFIGRYLVGALSHQGHTVRVLTRQGGNMFPAGVEVVKGDLISLDCPLDQFLHDCEVLFHCAGEIRNPNVMRLLHVEGTKRLIQAQLREHLRTGRRMHWVQLSSVGAYGPPIGRPQADRVITEQTRENPVNEYEITKTISDELVMQASKSGAMTYAILRPSNVFGTRTTNQSLRRLIEMVRRGLFFYVGKPGAVVTFVHVDDVVSALIVCGVAPRAKGQIYNLSCDCELEVFINHIASLLRVHRPSLRIPGPLIQGLLSLLSSFLKPLINIPSLNVLVLRTRYPTKKIETELGFKFSKPLPAGVEELVQEFL
jgi:nucleoside-diphosphate-sugar epimerase